MGQGLVKHNVNKEQMNMVINNFESTTVAIKGIEKKVNRVEGYIKVAEEQRDHFAWQADEATSLLDDMADNVNGKSEDALEYMMGTLDRFATLMEMLETTVSDLQLMSAGQEVKKEMGPLLIPAVVLVVIITGSNCIFGFLLAKDPNLADKMSPESMFGGETKDDSINILNIFAIFHVVLIALAVFHVSFEIFRQQLKKRRRRAEKRRHNSQMQEARRSREGMDCIEEDWEGEEGEEEERIEDSIVDTASGSEVVSVDDSRGIPQEPTTLSVSDAARNANPELDNGQSLPLELPPKHKSRRPPPLSAEDPGSGDVAPSEPSPAKRNLSQSSTPSSGLTSNGISPLRSGAAGSKTQRRHTVDSGRPSRQSGSDDPRSFQRAGSAGSSPTESGKNWFSSAQKDGMMSPSMNSFKSMRPESMSAALRSLGKKAGEEMERRKQGLSP